MGSSFRLTLFLSIFGVTLSMRCDASHRIEQISSPLPRNESYSYCSHYSDFWSWSESSYEGIQHLTETHPCNIAFSGNFPRPLEIIECNFTSTTGLAGNGSHSRIKKECSDECLVLIKMFVVEIRELELCYEPLLEKYPEECGTKNLPQQILNPASISNCNFHSKKDIIHFRLPNSKLHVCQEECISDIKLLLGKFHLKKNCYDDLRNVDTIIVNINTRRSNFTKDSFKVSRINANYFQRILAKVYRTHFPNLANVNEHLEQAGDRYKFAEALYEKMRVESDLRTNNIIILKKIVDDDVNRSCQTSINSSTSCAELQKLKTKVDNNADNVLDDWASKVRRNRFADIIQFGSPPTITPAGYAFQQVLSRLIDKAMDGNLENLKNTFAFVKKLRWNMHKFEALSKLKTWLSDADDRFQLLIASGIKDAMENLEGPDTKSGVEKGLESLKISYPQNLQNVVWNGDCRLRNQAYTRSYHEYLYSAEDEEYDFSLGTIKRVFTWARHEVPPNSVWSFENVEKDAEIRFLVRNVALGKYLCAYNDFKVPWTIMGVNIFKWETEIDDSRRYVSLADNFGDCEWYVEFHEKWREMIMLKNVGKSEYMYTSKYTFPTNDSARYPLLWKPGVKVGGQGNWILECGS